MAQLYPDFGKLEPGGEPVYLQLVRRFKLLVLQGRLRDGDEAPSRRMLAASLGVNPNTVQKAFAELEREGLINTPPNAKSLVRADGAAVARLRAELLEGEVAGLIATAREAGLGRAELLSLVDEIWGRVVK